MNDIDIEEDESRRPDCPKCDKPATLLQPAEPDVGIMGDLFACEEHGGFCFGADGIVEWVEL